MSYVDPSGESADGQKLLLEFGDMRAHDLGCALAVASFHAGDDLAVFFDRLAQALHPVERDIPQSQHMVVEPFERLLEELVVRRLGQQAMRLMVEPDQLI